MLAQKLAHFLWPCIILNYHRTTNHYAPRKRKEYEQKKKHDNFYCEWKREWKKRIFRIKMQMQCGIKLICCDNETEIIYGYKLVLEPVLTTFFFRSSSEILSFHRLYPWSTNCMLTDKSIANENEKEKIATRKPTVLTKCDRNKI